MLWTHRTRILVIIAILIGTSLVMLITRRTAGGGGELTGIDAGFGGMGGGVPDASRPLEAGKRD
jgi:hypothetical protein